MTETKEETLSRRALQLAKDVKHVVRIQTELARESLGTSTERELLLDPSPLGVVEESELFLKCWIRSHAASYHATGHPRGCETPLHRGTARYLACPADR